jgi:hypothetical protein
MAPSATCVCRAIARWLLEQQTAVAWSGEQKVGAATKHCAPVATLLGGNVSVHRSRVDVSPAGADFAEHPERACKGQVLCAEPAGHALTRRITM